MPPPALVVTMLLLYLGSVVSLVYGLFLTVKGLYLRKKNTQSRQLYLKGVKLLVAGVLLGICPILVNQAYHSIKYRNVNQEAVKIDPDSFKFTIEKEQK